MFNSQNYAELWFSQSLPPIEVTADDITFNGFSLISACNNETGIAIQTENSRDLANIDLSTFAFWQESGGGVLNRRYTNRTLNVTLTFIEKTYNDLITSIDNFKRNTRQVEWIFSIKDWGITKTAKATLTRFTVGSISVNDFAISEIPATFEILDPNWTVEPAITQTFEWITWNLTEEITNNWSTETFWKYYLLFKPTWNTAISSITVKVNEVPCTINETITNNDAVIFDMVNKEVTINGVEVDFDWFMQELDVGSNIIKYEFTATSVNLDISTLHNNILL